MDIKDAQKLVDEWIKEHGVTNKHRFSYKIVQEYSTIKNVEYLN